MLLINCSSKAQWPGSHGFITGAIKWNTEHLCPPWGCAVSCPSLVWIRPSNTTGNISLSGWLLRIYINPASSLHVLGKSLSTFQSINTSAKTLEPLLWVLFGTNTPRQPNHSPGSRTLSGAHVSGLRQRKVVFVHFSTPWRVCSPSGSGTRDLWHLQWWGLGFGDTIDVTALISQWSFGNGIC